jgi:uncharacterized protein YcfJ
MRRYILGLGAAAALLPLSAGLLMMSPAFAKQPRPVASGKAVTRRCRHSDGTAGLVAGGVAGAVIGGSALGGGAVGTLVGAAGGALAGRAIDRTITAKKRCSYVKG